MRTRLLTPLLLLLTVAPLAAQVQIEYIAHACFVVQSPAGQRMVIDPYNGNRWLGYRFPPGLVADVVAVSHPHYDHDAYYSVAGRPAVLREPGLYRFGDLEVRGIEGRHADPYGKDFGQLNTIWVVDTGGIRIAHLGDNGPLSPAAVRALGRIDVLMIPVDGNNHILKRDQIEEIRTQLKPAILIPMHYRIESLSELPESLGPIEPWLKDQEAARRLGSHRMLLSYVPGEPEVVVFDPSPMIRPWLESFHRAVQLADEARGLIVEEPDRAAKLFEEAVGLAPDFIGLRLGQAMALGRSGHGAAAIRTLEEALLAAGSDDWEYTQRARALLARLYIAAGRPDAARRQYQLVLRDTWRFELRQEAGSFLSQEEH